METPADLPPDRLRQCDHPDQQLRFGDRKMQYARRRGIYTRDNHLKNDTYYLSESSHAYFLWLGQAWALATWVKYDSLHWFRGWPTQLRRLAGRPALSSSPKGSHGLPASQAIGKLSPAKDLALKKGILGKDYNHGNKSP